MIRGDILTDTNFQPVAEVKADAKHRVVLGQRIALHTDRYKVYQNSLGQILLDPQITVSAREAWLFQHPEAAQMLRAGLDDAKHRRMTKAKEDYTRYTGDAD